MLAIHCSKTECVPVPDKVIVAGEFVALLAMLTLAPLTTPGVVGANVTVNVADWPGVRIVPFDTPMALKPTPATVAPEIVTFAFPLFVTEADCDVLVPSLTLPNARLVGLVTSDKVGDDPVPVRLIVSGDGVPLVVRLMVPVTAVPDDGVKTALNVALPPAAIVVEVERPVWLKPAPVTVISENVSVAFPLFLRTMGCELLLPTVTVPKLTLVGFAEICG